MDGDEKISKDQEQSSNSSKQSKGMKKLVDYDSSATSCSEVFNEEMLGELEVEPEPESFTAVSTVFEQETLFMNTQFASSSEVYISVPMTIRRENYLVEMNLNQFSSLPSQLFATPYTLTSEEDKESSTKMDQDSVAVSQNSRDIVDKENLQPLPCEEQEDAQSAYSVKTADIPFRSPTACGGSWRK